MQRRRLLLAGDALLLSPSLTLAGTQRKEIPSDDVASVMRGSISNVNPLWLVFASAQEDKRQLSIMSSRLAGYVPSEGERRRLLVNIQYETNQAGLNPRVVLGLIGVGSTFRQYAINGVGVRGLMQIMPFWKNYIDKPLRNLLDIHTNLRYYCTVLRHCNNLENGNLRCTLACFNSNLGNSKYPDAVLGAWCSRWQRS